MAILKATTVLHHISGLSEDRASVSLYFATAEAANNPAELALIQDYISDFWNLSHNNGGGEMGSLAGKLSPEISRTATLKIYDAEGAAPHYPLLDANFAISASSSASALPGEVALVGSFQAAKVSGQDQARRRGRVYIGPLNSDTLTTVSSVARPSQNFRDILGAAMQRMLTRADADPLLNWVVYSAGARERVLNADGKMRATGALKAPTQAAVANWWVDDAFDTQRRRGKAPTVKQTSVAGLVLDAS